MRRTILAASALSLAASTVALGQVQVNLVAMIGQPLPGVGGGGTVTSLNNPSVNGLGQVGFTGAINTGSGTTNFVYVNNAIVFRNDSVPGLTGAESQMGLSNAGDFNFSPSINGNDAVYTSSGKLLQETDPAPGFPGQNSVFNSRPQMAANGTAFWVGGIGPGTSTTSRVLYKATPTGGGAFDIGPVLAGGQLVAGEALTATGIEFAYAVSDNAANVINRVTYTGSTATDAAVVINGSTVVAREGSIPTGGTAAWQNFRSVDVNNNGDYVIYGDDSSTVDDILVYNGVVAVRQGDVLGGETLGSTIDGAALNNVGGVVQLWDLPGTNQEALFYGNASNLSASQLILRTGQGVDVDGDNVADFTLTDFNASSTISNPLDFADNGVVYLSVDLAPVAGGTAVEAIIGVIVPEPATAGAIAGAAVLLAGTRRRRR